MMTQLPAEAQAYLQLNYLLYLVEVMRAPMLGERPMLISYVVTILGAIGGWALAFVFYAYFRRRIAYWL